MRTKFEIYDAEPEEPERTVTFRLMKSGDSVELFVVDSNGRPVPCGGILFLTPERSGKLLKGVSKDLGILLDENGCLKLAKV